MTHTKSVKQTLTFPPEAADRVIVRAMGLLVGHKREWSFADLSAETGIPETSLRSYASGERSPKYHPLAAICGALGGAFTTRLFAPVGIGAFDMPELGDGDHVVSTIAKVAAKAAEHRENGVVDHVEREVEASELGPLLIVEGGRMIARGRAA